MKIISSSLHGLFDAVAVLVLVLMPNLFGFSEIGGAALWVPRIVGVLGFFHLVMTRYEFGVFKVIPMSLHLAIDHVLAVFLVASPWLFGFAHRSANVWLPHVLLGFAIIGLSLVTKEEEPARARA